MRGARRVVIGVDVGTTSSKAGVYRLDGVELRTHAVPTTLRRDSKGAVEQDPHELLTSAIQAIGLCVTEARVAPGDVVALAVTGQMAGLMGIDGEWNAVTPYDSWLDTRCSSQLEVLAAEHGDLLVERTGCPPMIDQAPKMQWWRDERPETYARVARWLPPAVYIAGRLTGLRAPEAFIDPTYLHFTGVADARRGTWSDELVTALAIDREKLPRVVACDTVIGHLEPDMAEACGLPVGTPVAAGMGDTAAGALGAGLVATGDLLDTAGTAAVLTGCVPDFRADPQCRLMVMHGPLPDQWLPLNYVAGGGLCLPWLAAALAPEPGVDLAQADPRALEALLEDAARIAPGAEGVTFVPHLEGRIAPYHPALRGGFTGLGLAHGRGHLARAVLEGIAFEYAVYLESMRRLHPSVQFSAVRAIGGGARSALWNAIKADVLGVPVYRVEVNETATRGAALLAGAAVNAVELEPVATAVASGPPHEPDPLVHARYAELLERYRVLVEASVAVSTTQSSPERSALV